MSQGLILCQFHRLVIELQVAKSQEALAGRIPSSFPAAPESKLFVEGTYAASQEKWNMEKTSSSSVVLPGRWKLSLLCPLIHGSASALLEISAWGLPPLNYLFPCGQKCIFHHAAGFAAGNSPSSNTCHSLDTEFIGAVVRLEVFRLPALHFWEGYLCLGIFTISSAGTL